VKVVFSKDDFHLKILLKIVFPKDDFQSAYFFKLTSIEICLAEKIKKMHFLENLAYNLQ
jgi:hypothetical protein